MLNGPDGAGQGSKPFIPPPVNAVRTVAVVISARAGPGLRDQPASYFDLKNPESLDQGDEGEWPGRC